jgi:hypothetical protein
MGDFTYRTREEVDQWKNKCPIIRLRSESVSIDPSEFDAIDHEVVVAAMPLTIAYRAVDDVLNIALWSTDGEAVYVTAQVTSGR